MIYLVWLISDNKPILKGIYSTHEKALSALREMERIHDYSLTKFRYVRPDLQISEGYNVDDINWLMAYR